MLVDGWVAGDPFTDYIPKGASKFFLPFLDVQYRKLKGRRVTKLLKGFEPYLGAKVFGKWQTANIVEEYLLHPMNSMGPIYGIQKRFNPFYLTLNAGPAYYFSLDFYEPSIDL